MEASPIFLGDGVTSSRPLYRPTGGEGPRKAEIVRGSTVRVAMTKASGTAPLPQPLRPGTMTIATATSGIHNHSGRPTVQTFEQSAYLERNARTRGITPFEARGTPPPSKTVDLSPYLIEAPREGPRGRGIEIEQSTQTDMMLPRPVTPPYRAPKTGVDASTQIAHGNREAPPADDSEAVAGGWDDRLFVFDESVAPLVDILTEKTIEQALIELKRESDLNRLHVRKVVAQSYLAKDAALDAQLTQVALGLAKTKADALAAGRVRAKAQMGVMQKVAAYNMARTMTRSTGKSVLWTRLHEWGYFLDPAIAAVRAEVWPDLLKDLGEIITSKAAAESTAEAILSAALQEGTSRMVGRIEAEERVVAEANRRYYIRVLVRVPRRRESVDEHEAAVHRAKTKCPHSVGEETPELCPSCAVALGDFDPAGKVVAVGPVPVQKADIVAKVEANVYKWLLSQREALKTGGDAAPAPAAGGPAPPSLADVERVLVLARGKPLRLFLAGDRMPQSSRLLDKSLDELADLELRPAETAAAPAEEEGAGDEEEEE